VEKESCGSPQSNGSGDTPVTPAFPVTSLTNAYRLSPVDSVREKFTDTLCMIRLCTTLSVTGTDRLDPVVWPPSAGKMLV